MKKILVFIYDHMADFEVTYATHILSASARKKVITIGYDWHCTVVDTAKA